MKKAGRYQFSEEEIKEVAQKRRENKDKQAEARLKALELRAKGAKAHEVAAAGFHAAYVTQLVGKCRNNGLKAIAGNHYGGNHRNMRVEREADILAPFKARAEKGELIEMVCSERVVFMRNETCCFTGHRQIPSGERAEIASRLERVISDLYQRGIRFYGAGDALGFDALAARTVLYLRKNCPGMKLILVLPCLTQTRDGGRRT